MPLGTEVGLGPSDIVLDGDPAPPTQMGRADLPNFLDQVYCGQTVGWISMPLGMEVGLGPSNIVLDGDIAPSHEKGHLCRFWWQACTGPRTDKTQRSAFSAVAELLLSLYFCPVVSFYLLSFFYSSTNLSRRRLDVYHTLTHGVALVRI